MQKIHRPYLEHYITYHCNLKCANCSVGSPFIDETYGDLESYKRDVDELGKYMHIGVMRLIGGEPTLNPNITEYLKYAKKSELADATSVATNGIKLLNMPEEFWDWCDIINLSIYENTNINYDKILNYLEQRGQRYNITNKLSNNDKAPKTVTDDPDKFKKVEEALDWGKQFRVLDQFEELPQDIAQGVYETCPMHKWCHTFKDGNYYRCGFSIHRNLYYDSIGVPLPYNLKETDKIVIDENFIESYNLAESSNEININACRFCKGFGNAIEPVNEPHRQLTRIEIKELKV